jgi:preprotein translocase subunit YajC
MDFIERIFGISPDGGSGELEFFLFLIPIIGVFALHYWRRQRRKK